VQIKLHDPVKLDKRYIELIQRATDITEKLFLYNRKCMGKLNWIANELRKIDTERG